MSARVCESFTKTIPSGWTPGSFSTVPAGLTPLVASMDCAKEKGRLVVKDGALFYPDEIHAALEITPFAKHLEPRTAGVGPPASR